MTKFDPTRPCSSKSKKPDRYTRKELEIVAKSQNVQDIPKKTMDKLCAELKSISQKQKSTKPPITKQKSTKPTITKQKSTKPTITKQKSTKPTITKQKILNILGKPCGTKFAKSGGYTRTQLIELAKKYKVDNINKKNMDTLCQDIQTKLSSTPTTTKQVQKTSVITAKKKTAAQKKSVVAEKKKTTTQKKMIKMIHKNDPHAFSPNYFFNQSAKKWEFISGAPNTIYSLSELKLKENSELINILENKYNLDVDKNKVKSHDDLIKLLLAYQNSKLLVAKKLKDKSLEDIITIVKNLKTPNNVQQIMDKYKFHSTDHKRSLLMDIIINTDQNKLAKEQIIQLSHSLGANPNDLDDNSKPSYYNIVQKIFPKEFRYIRSIHTNKAVASLTKKLLQLKTKKNPIKGKTTVKIPMNYVNYKNGNVKKFDFTYKIVSVSGYANLPKNWVGNDVTGLTHNKQWFEAQKQYQQKLSKVDQLLILSYTYGGDQLYHSWVSGKFSRTQLETSIKDKYQFSTEHLLPLLPILYKIYLQIPSKFSSFLKTNFMSTLKTKEKNELIKYMKEPDPLHSSIQFQIIGWMLQYISLAKASFYDELFKNYEIYLNQVIQSSPPVQHTMVVYKGLKDRDFITFDKKTNVFENNYFVSTSIDFVQSKRFAKHNCCLLKITVLKGTKCLFPIFTYYPTELEVLFPTKRKFYLTKDAYKPDNDKYIQTENVVVVN